jgi:hypothetical protein
MQGEMVVVGGSMFGQLQIGGAQTICWSALMPFDAAERCGDSKLSLSESPEKSKTRREESRG